MNLADVRHLFDYTEWANALTLDAANRLTDEHLHHNFGVSHSSIFETLLHIAGAEWIWFERWNGRSPARAEAWSQWTPGACSDIAGLKSRWASLEESRAKYFSELSETSLAEDLEFRLLSGDASSMQLVHQMQHVVNHSTLHRGQVVGMIRQLGIEPPSTDLIFFLRSDISPR